MGMIRETWKLSLAAAIIAAVVVGCGKKEEEPATPVAAPMHKTEKSKPAGVTPPPTAPVAFQTRVAPAPQSVVAPASSPQTLQQLATLEGAYTSNPEFSHRVETIYKISDIGTPEAIVSLGRLFYIEKDPDLKTEILDSLSDIDGLDDRKVALLTAAAGGDQPKDVRESAIDGLGDLDAKYALPILQSLASDPDEEIRDDASDQIDQLQSEQALQKP